jgi:GrpB-like predicted nucleotidyltransferase (UPF0157 family)
MKKEVKERRMNGRGPSSEEYLKAHTVGELKPLSGAIHIADYDPVWPEQFEAEAARIRSALGERALLLEHTGSTSVPGLPAKPIIDILMVVADSAREVDYAPALEIAGYRLHIREPEWYEHRLFNDPDPDVEPSRLLRGLSGNRPDADIPRLAPDQCR